MLLEKAPVMMLSRSEEHRQRGGVLEEALDAARTAEMLSGAWIHLREVISRRTNVFRIFLGRDPPAKVEPMRVLLKAGATPVEAKRRDYKLERRSSLSGFVAVLVV
ncbi:unnamed protein product, partial [Discosporangium mesarthrocarpum]